MNFDSQSANPIDVNQIDLEKMREKTTDQPGLLPYAHTSGSAIIRPEDMNKTLARSLGAMEQQTEMQMQQIVAQMKLLADQASAIQQRKIISERIYQADMRFEPLIAHTYYLYKRDGKDMISLVAPNEWGRSAKVKLTYVAKVVLLADHTWDVKEIAPEPVEV
ncbi:MAG TPA: DUF2452 domain-containing protein [Catalimonadaceae bacterium]|nr:DUF2452 domain-containing protein [Catalimonadaceae bacterium]